ncbi:ATP-dependent DNA ligase [Lysinibacillus sp. RC46]
MLSLDLKQKKRAFRQIAKHIATKVDRDMIWLEPRLYCKVQYLEKTNSGLLRTVSFKGFCFDKEPEECIY